MSDRSEIGSGQRVVIENVSPAVDGGRFPIKRTAGEVVVVEADILADGHDPVAGRIVLTDEKGKVLTAPCLEVLGNDRFRGEFTLGGPGRYHYAIEGWIDHFSGWLAQFQKRIEGGSADNVDLEIGTLILRETAGRAPKRIAGRLTRASDELMRPGGLSGAKSFQRALRIGRLAAPLAREYPDPDTITRTPKAFPVEVNDPLARFSAWYEMFPRSWAFESGRHGTFDDIILRLPYVANMGFDILYFAPLHPIGATHRKGRNNALKAEPGEPGSPWGIGAGEGGHKAVHPELGTLDDFKRLVKIARESYGIEIALDIALQCSPDHPYVVEHPEWFRRRPDGTLQYAENPPKKYQDIYPFDFDCQARQSLWLEMRSIFEHWIDQGVRVFRVDNPHTKPFAFWEWLLSDLKVARPDLIFLSEAFTRPAAMRRLAKVGFTQSYTYFTWRNDKWELESYLSEVMNGPHREYFRPNFWPNTPDILHEYLQTGGRPAFIVRLVLAATAAANYGIYGPAFELTLAKPREPGSEEYWESEKYEIKQWNLEDPESLAPLITQINRIRRENPALQSDWSAGGGLMLHPIDNPLLLFYSKRTADASNIILVAVNLDPYNTQIGWVDLPLDRFGIGWDEAFEVEDLLTGSVWSWRGARNYIELNPHHLPAHILRVRR